MGWWDSFKRGFNDARYGIEPETWPSPKERCIYDYCCKIVNHEFREKDRIQAYDEILDDIDINDILTTEHRRYLVAMIYKAYFEYIQRTENI